MYMQNSAFAVHLARKRRFVHANVPAEQCICCSFDMLQVKMPLKLPLSGTKSGSFLLKAAFCPAKVPQRGTTSGTFLTQQSRHHYLQAFSKNP